MPLRIYCAGPLFNEAEKGEMATLAELLERAGYATFLPQRDGLPHSQLAPELEALGLSAEDAGAILARAIFALDVHEVLRCDALVFNMNGRVPDEGAAVEAAIAWQAGKPVVLYKADARRLFGTGDNPLLAGLGGFEAVDRLSSVPDALNRLIRDGPWLDPRTTSVVLGERISRLRVPELSAADLAKAVAAVSIQEYPPGEGTGSPG